MATPHCRARSPRGIFHLTRTAIRAVAAMCWLGILAALCALPVVYFDRSWLLGSLHADVIAVDKARVAEHLRSLIEVLLNLLDLLLDIGSEALLVSQ